MLIMLMTSSVDSHMSPEGVLLTVTTIRGFRRHRDELPAPPFPGWLSEVNRALTPAWKCRLAQASEAFRFLPLKFLPHRFSVRFWHRAVHD